MGNCGCQNGGIGTVEANSSDCKGEGDCGRNLHGSCIQQNCGPTCGCNPSQVVTPAPFYCNAPGIQENHAEVTVMSQYVTGITIASSFNMPACNQTAVIVVPGLQKILLNGYLWNPTYGYLKIISFDYANSLVVVKNECQTGNAPIGSTIPSCTLFTVVDTPTVSGGGIGPSTLYPFLAIDFVAPAVGVCITINVTNVNGLAVGKNVSIGGGTYRISAIISGTQITICNDGAGVTPGATVIATDPSGNFITPVVLIDASPCTNLAVPSGTLLVCHGGITQPLDAIAVNMVPVVTDATTNEVTFQALDIPTRVCTILTVCLSLQPGIASYVITVTSNADFQLGDKLYIGNDTTTEYTITNINVDGIHMTVTVDPVPVAFIDIDPGASVCWVGCCEQIVDVVTNISNLLANPCLLDLDSRFRQHCEFLNTSTDLNGQYIPFNGSLATEVIFQRIRNTSCMNLQVLALIGFGADYQFDTTACQQYTLNKVGGGTDTKIMSRAEVNLEPCQAYAVGAPGILVPTPVNFEHVRKQTLFDVRSATLRGNSFYNSSLVITVPPGQEVVVSAQVDLNFASGNGVDPAILCQFTNITKPLWAYIHTLCVSGSITF